MREEDGVKTPSCEKEMKAYLVVQESPGQSVTLVDNELTLPNGLSCFY